MTTHPFRSTETAYAACQCDGRVKDGDVLDIAEEGVVGLAWTWPVAVTAEPGDLHVVSPNPGAVERVAADAGWTHEQIAAAVALACERGYGIAEGFQDYAPAVPSI